MKYFDIYHIQTKQVAREPLRRSAGRGAERLPGHIRRAEENGEGGEGEPGEQHAQVVVTSQCVA